MGSVPRVRQTGPRGGIPPRGETPGHVPARRQGRARAQPAQRGPGPAPRLHDRLHRALRLGQVLPGLRHDLRRGPAPVRRIAVRLRPAVPGPGGQARRRLHRGPLARGVHRPEVHQQEPPLHRGHHHRDLRLHAPAVGPCRPPALPRLRRARREADPAADRRPAAGTAGGHPLPGPGPGGPRPQGRIRRTVQGTHRQGLLAGAGRRQAHPAERSPQAGQAVQAHHRGGRGPARGQGRHQPAPHRLGGNRPRPGRGPDPRRIRRPRRRRPGTDQGVLRAPRLPQRAPPRDRRDRTPLLLLQQPLRRLLGLQRHRHEAGGRRGTHHPERGTVPRGGRHRAVVPRHRHDRVLEPPARRSRQGTRLLHDHARGTSSPRTPARPCCTARTTRSWCSTATASAGNANTAPASRASSSTSTASTSKRTRTRPATATRSTCGRSRARPATARA